MTARSLDTTPQLHRIVRSAELRRFTGLAMTRINELIRNNRFPKPVRLSDRRHGWLEGELQEWQRQKIAERDNGGAPDRDYTAPAAQTAKRWRPTNGGDLIERG